MPKVSVIIPAYNSALYLGEAIDSVLNQTFQDFEIIIIDDGSTDGTKALVEKYLNYPQPKVRYYYQENNGPVASRNLGIKVAKGEYLAFLDSDDCYLPRFLEECIVCLEEENLDVVIPKCFLKRFIDRDDNNQIETIRREDFPKDFIELYKLLYEKHAGSQVMVVIRKCFELVGLYDEESYVEDWDIWIRFAQHHLRLGQTKTEQPLWIYRIREGSRWNSSANEAKKLLGQYQVLKKHQKAAFVVDPSFKKVYAGSLGAIGKGLMCQNSYRLLGCRLMLKSLYYDFNIRRIGGLFSKMCNQIIAGIISRKKLKDK
ncbi:MAG: glycosyltransferase family 2 protein [Candidatus Omnitrophica bacterium]|nr:glycosyltransferase family 2 protein [Candidatus Omnitrophota bacterium]